MHPIIAFFTSLRLTVWLLALSIILVFFGTLDQVHYGIWKTQEMYFQSWFVVWHYPPQWLYADRLGWLLIPMPAGYTLGALLLVNLIAAHVYRFKLSWKKSGILLVHVGLVLLLVGELLTHLVSEESQMPIDVGSSTHYSYQFHENELVLIDRSPADYDTVHSVPVQRLRRPNWIEIPTTGLSVRAIQYFPNAEVGQLREGGTHRGSIANRGLATRMNMVANPAPEVYAENEINTATAFVEVHDGNESLGIWLVSNVLDERFPAQIVDTPDGRSFELALRFRRIYHPFRMELLEFSHDRYPGTEIPHNFSSQVRIHHNDPARDRSALIFMNNPLRYEGLTFYQASFANQDQTSILQVVRNPSWTLPYISVLMMTLGLLVQFGIHFKKFLSKKTKGGAA
jgi:hypothetical protein